MSNIIETIKSTGYWKVIIRPISFEKELINSLSDCKDIINKTTVSFRGWDFPSHESIEIKNMDDGIESETDWNQYKEYWRFHQSGQFLHLYAFNEDYQIDDIERKSSVVYLDSSKRTSKYLSIFSTLFRITEIFEFISRLIEIGIYTTKIKISIELFDVNGRMLFIWDRYRDLRRNYTAALDSIHYFKEFDVQEMIEDKFELALECTMYIFERFNWDQPPMGVLREDQKKLIEKRQ